MKTKLLIFPYNGNGLEALGCLSNDYDFIGFIDDEPAKQGMKKERYTVFSREAIRKYKTAKILAVPGSPATYLKRRKIINSIRIPDTRFAQVIHKSAQISPLAKIGFNVLIMAGVVITSNAIIGNHVCILPNTVIHHDVIIGEFSLIGSNVAIAGGVILEKNCYLGSGSNIINNVRIGKYSLIGLGSNVINSFPARARVVGNPARII